MIMRGELNVGGACTLRRSGLGDDILDLTFANDMYFLLKLFTSNFIYHSDFVAFSTRSNAFRTARLYLLVKFQ